MHVSGRTNNCVVDFLCMDQLLKLVSTCFLPVQCVHKKPRDFHPIAPAVVLQGTARFIGNRHNTVCLCVRHRVFDTEKNLYCTM